MEQKEALARLAEIIDTNYKHKHYDYTCELYEKYLALSTGIGINNYLRRFSSRESDQAFSERLAVTIDICKSVIKNLCHVFYRVTRSTGIKISYDAGSKDEDYAKILKSYGRYGLAGYMEKRYTDFNKIDPNGYLVVDFIGTDGTQYAKPYPVEFYSPDVVDYLYILNVLEYLAVKQDFDRADLQGALQPVSDYTIYTAEGAVKYIARPDIENAPPFEPNRAYVTGDLVGFHHQEVEYKDERGMTDKKLISDVYELVVPLPYNLPYTPAIAMGYLPDEATRGETFVNFFDNATPFLEKIIKVNSESDISSCKHAFPQKIQFVKACPNKAMGCEQNAQGVYYYEGHICPVCHGHGFIEAHSSGLDVIYLPLNDDTKEFNLDNMVKYVAVPIETLQYQDNKLQDLIEMCKRVIYNTDIFSKQEVSETATAKLIEMENMYDTIYTYAVHYGDAYRWQYNTISDITEIDAQVDVSVSKDFRMLTKAQLIEMLQAAMNAGASPAIIEKINDELVYSFTGNTDEYDRYQKTKDLIPFGDKTPEQIAMILADLPRDNVSRVAYIFGEEIVKKLEVEDKSFFEKIPELRRSLFDAKVAELAATMKVSAMPTFNWGEQTETEETPE